MKTSWSKCNSCLSSQEKNPSFIPEILDEAFNQDSLQTCFIPQIKNISPPPVHAVGATNGDSVKDHFLWLFFSKVLTQSAVEEYSDIHKIKSLKLCACS